MIKRKGILLFVFLSLLLFSSCHVIEMEQFAFVSGIALDKKEDHYELYAELAITQKGDTTDISSSKIQTTGKNIFDCFDSLPKINAKIPNLSHCNILLIGEKLAKEGVDELFEYILKDLNLRLTTHLIVLKDGSISDFLDKKPKDMESIFDTLEKILMNNEKKAKVFYPYTFADIYNQSLIAAKTFVVPICYWKNESLAMDGACLFQENKKVELLSQDDSDFVKLFQKKLTIDRTNFLEDYPFLLKSVSVKLSFSNAFQAKYKVKLEIYFDESPKDYSLAKEEDLLSIQKEVEEGLTQKWLEQLNAFSKNDWDCLFLGLWMYQSSPNKYHEYENTKEAFTKMKFSLECKVDIISSNYVMEET